MQSASPLSNYINEVKLLLLPKKWQLQEVYKEEKGRFVVLRENIS